MQKYIEGRKFNTATARKIGVKTNGFNSNALNYTEEALYLKKSGVYFLYKKSGPLGKYGIKKGNENKGQELIEPISFSKAKIWTKNNLTYDIYSRYFERPTKDEKKVVRTYSFTKEADAILHRANQKTGKDQSQILEDLIKKYLIKLI